MEFSCPACGTPHAFPEDQIPDSGIVVACTRCEAHITLDRNGVVVEGDASASAPPAPSPPRGAPEPEPTVATSAVGAGWDLPGGIESTSAELARQEIPKKEPPAPAPRPPATRGAWPQPAAAPSKPAPEPPKPAPEPPKPAPEPPRPAPDAEARLAVAPTAAAGPNAAERARAVLDSAAADEMEPEREVPEGLAFPGFRAGEGSWTWRDLPRAFMGVFDARRVAFTTVGFWAALIGFALLQWLGGWLGAKVTGILGTVFSVAAWAVLVGVSAFVASVMGYVCHQVVVEQRPSSIKAGVDWTRQWIKSVVGTPLAFAGVVAIAAVAEGVLAALGRIPFAGPIVWGLATPAVVLLSVAAGAVLVAFIYSLPLYIPVVYNEQTGPVETLKRLLHLFRTHGFELVGYVLLTIVMIGVAFAVTVFPAYFIPYAYLTGRVAGAAMGENLMATILSAPTAFQDFVLAVVNPLGAPFPTSEPGFGHTLGGIFAGIGTAFGPALLMALMALCYYTAGGIIYGIVTGRRKA